MSLATRLHRLVVQQVDVPALGVVRIIIAGAALLNVLEVAPRLGRLTDSVVMRMPHFAEMPEVTPAIRVTVLAVWVLSAAAFLVGWRTRVAGATLTAVIAFTLLLDEQLYSNHLYLLGLVCLLLVCADSGAYHSLDGRRAPRRGTPAWPVTLLKVQVSIVYGFAAAAKLNMTYLTGDVIAFSLRQTGPLAFPQAWRVTELMLPIAWLSILVEVYLAVALWTNREQRSAFIVGVVFHAGLVVTVNSTYEIATFAMVTLALYLPFLRAPRIPHLAEWSYAPPREWAGKS